MNDSFWESRVKKNLVPTLVPDLGGEGVRWPGLDPWSPLRRRHSLKTRGGGWSVTCTSGREVTVTSQRQGARCGRDWPWHAEGPGQCWAVLVDTPLQCHMEAGDRACGLAAGGRWCSYLKKGEGRVRCWGRGDVWTALLKLLPWRSDPGLIDRFRKVFLVRLLLTLRTDAITGPLAKLIYLRK